MENSKQSMPTYFGILPANVRYADISMGAKILYTELTALCQKEGYCWATNSYFAKLYGVSNHTIINWLNSLKKSGFIVSEVDVQDGNSRRIWIENFHEVVKKSSRGSEKNFIRGSEKIFTYNNTSINNKNNNKNIKKENNIGKIKPKEDITDDNTNVIDSSEQFIQAIHKQLGGKKRLRAVDKPIQLLKRRRNKFTDAEIALAALHLSKSTWHMGDNPNGWHADVIFLLRNDNQVEKWLNDDSFNRKEEKRWDGIA